MRMFQWKGAFNKKRVELNKTIEKIAILDVNKEKIEKTKADIRLESLEKRTHTQSGSIVSIEFTSAFFMAFLLFFFFYFGLLA